MPKDPIYQKIIGETIRRYRKQADLTQEELGEKVDLHAVYISDLERGKEMASGHAMIRIAKVLKVRFRDLVEDA